MSNIIARVDLGYGERFVPVWWDSFSNQYTAPAPDGTRFFSRSLVEVARYAVDHSPGDRYRAWRTLEQARASLEEAVPGLPVAVHPS